MAHSGSIIREMQKRPFIRPLFFWILGTMLQVCLPLQLISYIIPVSVFIIIVLSKIICRDKNALLLYHARWGWGLIFLFLVVFLAIQMTYLKELSFGIPHTANSLISKAGEVQRYMVEQLNLLNSPDSEKAVLATITVGYRQAMNSELNRQFATTGVSHILSVSGYHVGIVSGFVTVLLSFIPNTKTLFRWIKFLLTILTVWAFTYISGLSTAAVRAAVMISIFLTARVLSRTYDSYNTLAGAAFCMLVYNPFYLFDIGFQLSYIAVFFLLYLQPRFRSLLAIRNPLIAVPWDAVTVTCAAQLGAIFLCFYYFGQSSLVFVFTNLFMSLISIILIPATLLWMLLPKWIPGISILTGIIEYLSHNMMWVIGEYASMPGAALSLRFDFFTMVMSYMTLAFVLIYSRTKRFRHLAASLVSLLIILVWYLIKG